MSIGCHTLGRWGTVPSKKRQYTLFNTGRGQPAGGLAAVVSQRNARRLAKKAKKP